MTRASREERDYFERVELANRALEQGSAPESFADMLDQLQRMRRTLGALARPGVDAAMNDGDLASHLAFLSRLKRIAGARGAKRP